MGERTLVCILGQTRAHELTWANFERNVLQELDAELAICVGHSEDYDRTNPFYRRARHRWFMPEPEDYATEIDRIALGLGAMLQWRQLLPVGNNWLGAAGGCSGSGAVLIVFRWFLRDCLLRSGLTEVYDRFVVTRSDFVYTAPHPNLDALGPDYVWVPDGENYGGFTDRHLVASAADILTCLDLVTGLVTNPGELINELSAYPHLNLEACLHNHFRKTGLLAKLRRTPYFMYSVRGGNDSTRWSAGEFREDLGYAIKYPAELRAALEARESFKTQADWLGWSRSLAA